MRNLLKAFAVFVICVTASVNANALTLGVGKGQIINLPRPAAHVFIADPDIADVDVRSPDYIYVYGLRVGETSLHALDANGNSITQVEIAVSPNLGNIGKILKEVLPDSKVKFSTAENGVILQGEVDTPEDAQKVMSIVGAAVPAGTNIVNMVNVRGSDQVMLRVRIAEVSRNELKNFGINLQDILSNGSFTFGLLTGRSFLATASALNPLGISRGDSNNVVIGGNAGSHNITGVIDALENNGLLKILAEPNLTAKSGETASFLAGGEFPIPVPQEDGVITVQYRQFGVQLEFTPTVMSNDKISLRVAPEVSTLAPSTVSLATITVPNISTRRVNTTVELGSGESFAIAGLMRSDVTNDIDKFPWIGDVPILGALFRSNSFQSQETELVVVITPYIVRGVSESEKIMTPTDGFEVPNDFDRILMGDMHKVKEAGRQGTGPVEGKIAKYKLNGDAGYALDDEE